MQKNIKKSRFLLDNLEKSRYNIVKERETKTKTKKLKTKKLKTKIKEDKTMKRCDDMKYYVYRFNHNSGFMFKRTKCNDYWSRDFSVCWQFSKQGAKKIVDRENEKRKNSLNLYGMVEANKVEKMLADYEKHLDMQTYMAECMNERPYWI